MLDDLLKGMEQALNLADEMRKMEQRMTPELMKLQTQAKSEGADPELMKMYNEQLAKIESGRTELNKVTEDIKNMNL